MGATPPLGDASSQRELAVVIVTYNSAAVIGTLLDSLPAALGSVTRDVVVVDNGSTDDTAQVVGARSDCRLIRSTNLGYAAGINRGVSEAALAPAILILNPDVVLRPGCVQPMMSALQLPGTAAVAPKVFGPDGALQFSLRRTPTIPRAMGLNFTTLPVFSEYVNRRAEYTEPHVVDWALGAVLLISRDCFDRVGAWDESFFLYSEETDFSLRCRDIGMVTRYEPSAEAMHIGGESGRDDSTHSMLIVNRVRLYRRRHTAAASWTYYACTIASELSWIARGHRESRRAVMALLRPSTRPPQLRCSRGLMPR
jgi:N-acetylglucosaminyl-diphospho-decaprenol L-rhamnosyltransferase